MSKQTASLPPLPPYTLHPKSPLLPYLSDFHLSLLLPVAAYWLMSLIFHIISTKNYFPQHRIHTPAEIKHRNRVSAAEVLRSVVLQQLFQTALGLAIGWLANPGDFYGKEEYDIAVWAGRIRQARQVVPWVLAAVGIDAKTIGETLKNYAGPFSSGTGVGAANKSANVTNVVIDSLFFNRDSANGFAAWEMRVAKVVYWILEPALRFSIAVFFSDSWQYFWHRAMHSNKWMYRNMHSYHHQMYVPYAFGAFYNTLAEAFLLDTIGTTLSLALSGLSIRQSMCFGTISVMKGVDDHCGYNLPWDPLQWGNEQNTDFHDVHHQSWGMKSNYSQVYTTFWDHVCNTVCSKSSEEIELLYEKGRMLAAEKSGEKGW